MTTTITTIRSWPALGLGLFTAFVTGRVLLDDCLAGAPFTTAHLVSISALVSAIGAGHLSWQAIRQRAILPGLVLAAVAAGATGYIVVSAGMRNAETTTAKAEAASKAGDDRRAAAAEWRRLSDEFAGLPAARDTIGVRAAMDAVVGKGEGKVPVRVFTATAQCTDITRPASAEACRPLLDLRVEMATAIRRADLEPKVAAARSRLEAMKPVVSPATGYAKAAAVLASVPYVSADAESIQRRLDTLMPFAGVVIGELATIGFLAFGLGHSRSSRAPATPIAGDPGSMAGRPPAQSVRGGRSENLGNSHIIVPDRPAAGTIAGPSENGRKSAIMAPDRPVPRTKPAGPSGKSREEAEADLLTMLALGLSVPSQRTLADRWGRPKQTVSDWLKDWERSGTIPARQQVGREKAIAAAQRREMLLREVATLMTPGGSPGPIGPS